MYILKEGSVVTIPGSEFHKAGFIRLAYANSNDKTIEDGMEALSNILQTLK